MFSVFHRMNTATNRFYPRQFLLLRYLYQNSTTKEVHYECIANKLENDINPLDNFTTQLMQQKVIKWNKNIVKNNVNISNYNRITNLISPVKYEAQIGQENIQNDPNIASIQNDLKEGKHFPSATIISILELCAQKGDKSQILEIEVLCRENFSEFLETHSHFKHYLAEAIWVGGNITESVRLFDEVYANNSFLRKKIRLVLKNLIENCVKNKSEAVLVRLTNFAKKLSTKYDDFFPLSCIWQTCILSEWFSDQKYALDLLENDHRFIEAVANKLQYVVVVALYSHKMEVVYRILEILLKNDMKVLYSGVLLALLDYQIHQRNLPRCLEIIKWSMENHVDISSGVLKNFIVLLLSHQTDPLTKVNSEKLVTIRDYKF